MVVNYQASMWSEIKKTSFMFKYGRVDHNIPLKTVGIIYKTCERNFSFNLFEYAVSAIDSMIFSIPSLEDQTSRAIQYLIEHKRLLTGHNIEYIHKDIVGRHAEQIETNHRDQLFDIRLWRWYMNTSTLQTIANLKNKSNRFIVDKETIALKNSMHLKGFNIEFVEWMPRNMVLFSDISKAFSFNFSEKVEIEEIQSDIFSITMQLGWKFENPAYIYLMYDPSIENDIHAIYRIFE